ncbi:MAG TPA: DUF4350 domain-containing protein [Phycisphaerae bacterium]
MRTIRLIARREWLATVLSPTGLIVIVLYLAVCGYVFWLNVSLTQEATLRYTFGTLGVITAFVVPLITMRLLSEELRSGTFEVLTSHPVRDVEIVLGKYLAGYLAFLALSVPTLGYVLILQVFGAPDWGPALCAYLGQQLLALMLLALGLLASSLTANQVLAAMAATIGGILLLLAGTAATSMDSWLGRALAYLAMFEHFSLFRRGVIDTRALAYFVVTALMFLYLAVRAVESHRWKFGALPGHLTATWRAPRISIALFVVAGLALIQGWLWWMTRGGWTVTSLGFVVLGVAAAGTPLWINRARLRYELARRRMGLMVTVAVNSLLVITIWALVTYLTARHYVRLDLTSSKHYALSDQTRMVLDQLAAPADVVVIAGGPTDLRQEVTDLLAEYSARCPRVNVRVIDPIRSPSDIEQIKERYKLTTLPANEVLVAMAGEAPQAGGTPALQVRRIPISAMVRQKILVADQRPVGATVQFVGEAEITGALIQLTRKAPGRIVFLSGHAERSPDEPGSEGLATIAGELRRNGWSVEKQVVTPGSRAAFPADTSVAVVAAPAKKLSDEDLKAISEVLDRGGGVLLLLEPGAATGLEPLVQDWNIKLGDDVVVDLQEHLAAGDATSLYVSKFSQEHPIGKGMGALAAVLPTARRVAVAAKQFHTNVFTNNFMHTSGQSWAVAYQPGAKLQVDKNRDKQGPISVGMACERFAEFAEPGRAPLTGRLVVIGDSDFATNHYIDMAGNLDLFMNCVDWLGGRQDLVSVRPKVTDVRRMALTARQTQWVFWLALFGVPGFTLLAGGLAIGRRRRRA